MCVSVLYGLALLRVPLFSFSLYFSRLHPFSTPFFSVVSSQFPFLLSSLAVFLTLSSLRGLSLFRPPLFSPLPFNRSIAKTPNIFRCDFLTPSAAPKSISSNSWKRNFKISRFQKSLTSKYQNNDIYRLNTYILGTCIHVKLSWFVLFISEFSFYFANPIMTFRFNIMFCILVRIFVHHHDIVMLNNAILSIISASSIFNPLFFQILVVTDWVVRQETSSTKRSENKERSWRKQSEETDRSRRRSITSEKCLPTEIWMSIISSLGCWKVRINKIFTTLEQEYFRQQDKKSRLQSRLNYIFIF